MKKFIAFCVAALTTASAFAFDFNNSDDKTKFYTTGRNLDINYKQVKEELIVAAEELLKDMKDSGIDKATDDWKYSYIWLYCRVFYNRNKDASFETKHNAAKEEMKAIGLDYNANLGQTFGNIFIFYDGVVHKDVYNYLMSNTGDWKRTFGDGGFYAAANGDYKNAYELYVAQGWWTNRAISIAINQLKDNNKALAAAKNIASIKMGPNELNEAVGLIIGKLYTGSKDKAEVISILEDINFTYSQYLKKESGYLEPLTRVRQTLDAYYSVKR